ncbi:transposase [soil metagenome]
MVRTARAAVGGICYHVLNRGNNKSQVYDSSEEYLEFLTLMRAAQERIAIDVLAVCLMPTHFHCVLRPVGDKDMGRWMHWLLTTHVRRRQARTRSTGHVWQGRYKAFPIEQDEHLLMVMRYVERNALRANLVRSAENWRWGSLHWRTKGRPLLNLAECPVPLPRNWAGYVNEPQSNAEIEALRICVRRERPFGSARWVRRAAAELGLEASIRSVGNPRRSRKRQR